MFKILFPILIFISFPIEALSGQFGLEVGESIESIRGKGITLKNDGGFWYVTNKLPKSNSQIDNYSLLITPVSGLCRIVGNTERIKTNSFGDQVKSKFEFFETALNKKYGISKKYDFVREGSLWQDDQYWMMGILKRERYLRAAWRKDDNNLPSDIRAIVLSTHAIETDEGVISLNYEFFNVDKCREEKNKADTDNL